MKHRKQIEKEAVEIVSEVLKTPESGETNRHSQGIVALLKGG